MGFGTKDSRVLFKNNSVFESSTAGQLKSKKQNNYIQRESV
jgi:hypothetical protein